MRYFCYFRDIDNNKTLRISVYDLARAEKSDFSRYLYIKKNIFIDRAGNIPLEFVRRNGVLFFRIKGEGKGNFSQSYRGRNESNEHEVYKEAISRLKSFYIDYGKEKVKLYVKDSTVEAKEICNGNTYYIDVCILLERTEPEVYYKEFNKEIFIEICYKHPTGDGKITDLRIANKTVFEYRIAESFKIADVTDEKTLEKIVSSIVAKMENDTVWLRNINSYEEPVLKNWKRKDNGNLFVKGKNCNYTIFKSDYSDGYVIAYGDGKKVNKFSDGRPIMTIDEAKTVANRLAKEMSV